jgi:hypothetical protein
MRTLVGFLFFFFGRRFDSVGVERRVSANWASSTPRERSLCKRGGKSSLVQSRGAMKKNEKGKRVEVVCWTMTKEDHKKAENSDKKNNNTGHT